jgi:hypothetical protein
MRHLQRTHATRGAWFARCIVFPSEKKKSRLTKTSRSFHIFTNSIRSSQKKNCLVCGALRVAVQEPLTAGDRGRSYGPGGRTETSYAMNYFLFPARGSPNLTAD